MKVDHAKFKKAMKVVEHARESRTVLPILSMVRASQAAAGLTLQTTDLDTQITTTMPSDTIVKGDLDSFLLDDPRALISSINAAGGKDVAFRIAKGKDKGIDHQVSIAAGDLKLSQRNNNSVEDFPYFPAIADEQFATEISADIITQISRVFPAISTEETRYYLNGVNVKKLNSSEGDWTYRFAATDGHRLFVVDVPLPSSVGDIGDVIIPRRFIQSVTKELGKSKDAVAFKVGIGTASNQKPKTTAPDKRTASRCSIGGKAGDLAITFEGKLIDGTYPDYSRVIPTNVPRQASFDAKALRRAVHAVSCANSNKSLRALKLEFSKGAVTISKMVGPHSGSNASFQVASDHNCEKMTAGFNGQYLLEALNSFKGDEIVLSMEEPGKDTQNKGQLLPVSAATLIRDPSDTAFFVVLMPMRV